MSRNFAVISKPLQFFNVINIPEVDETTILLITNTFTGAYSFFENLKIISNYNCYFFQDAKEPYTWLRKYSIKGDTLFINSDYGVKQTIWLWPLRNRNIFVYEEGIGTYRTDLIQKKFPIKNLLKFFGFKSYFGGGRFTDGIYVYDKEKFLSTKNSYKKEVLEFNNSFIQHLRTFKFNELIYRRPNNLISLITSKRVMLYITSWEFNNGIHPLLEKYDSYFKIIKPHPHAVNLDRELYNHFDVIMDGGLMVEYLILDLLDYSDDLLVIHENSSSMMYFINSSNVKHIILD